MDVVTSGSDRVVRDAGPDDIAAICRFGAAHVPPHYTPLIGREAADDQVRMWWNEDHISAAVVGGCVVVAEAGDLLVGVGQRGRLDADDVVYKLYVHPEHRSRGIGPQLLDALIRQLPHGATRLFIEHVAANERAGEFYERQGFVVDRIDPSPSGDSRHAQVWRVLRLGGTA